MHSVSLPIATVEDTDSLMALALDAFARNAELYGGYPPGLESREWHEEHISDGYCHRIMDGDELVGGIYLIPHPEQVMKLDFIFVGVKFQGKKIGNAVLELMEEAYPDVKKWFLHTPYKDYGNHYFYEKHGYVKVGEVQPDKESEFLLFHYEKEL